MAGRGLSAAARSRGMGGGEPLLDWLVLTAASPAQARGYRAQLAARQRQGAFPAGMRCLVISDPKGRRAGSGSATFLVLDELARRLGTRRRRGSLFERQRVLILHCGGDSRRLPAYAAQGKLFLPLPREVGTWSREKCDTGDGRHGGEGRPGDLFDLILEDLLPLIARQPREAGGRVGGTPDGAARRGRILIASGDVLLGVAKNPVPDLTGAGLTGVAFWADARTGSRHGVYRVGADGRVTGFLQKPSPAEAAAAGAARRGKVLIDTGLVAMDPATAHRWLAAAGGGPTGRERPGAPADGLLKAIRAAAIEPIDLYAHILPTIAPAGRPGAHGPAPALARRLRRGPFRVAILPRCDFLHIGTTRQLLQLIPRSRALNRAPEPLCIFNSLVRAPVRLEERGRAGPAAVVESCLVRGPLSLGGENVLVGVDVPPAGMSLPRGIGMVVLPIGARQSAAVLFGSDDDGKTPADRGGTFLNAPLRDWALRHGLHEADLWPRGGDRTLWTARLWTFSGAAGAARGVLWMLGDEPPPKGWPGARRLSLPEILPKVDHRRLIEMRLTLQRHERAANLGRRLADDRFIHARAAVSDLEAGAEAVAALTDVLTVALAAPALDQARLLRAAAVIRERFPRVSVREPAAWAGLTAEELDRASLDSIRRAVAADASVEARGSGEPPQPSPLRRGETACASAPVRVDLAGGWTDTPPIAQEIGGAVVNAAVRIDGRRPVFATARLIDAPEVRITSIDLGRTLVLRDARSVLSHREAGDAGEQAWAALPKAALVLAGVAPADPGRPGANLQVWLAALGARAGGRGRPCRGLEIAMNAGVPKGSGLGTSSILGAVILAALERLMGRRTGPGALIRRTSVLEQMISTGGGWQDQAGGITPGAKLLLTCPGPRQTPVITPLPLDLSAGSEIGRRTLLYFTGYQRLAAGILHKVVARFLERDPATLAILSRLKAGALEMRESLRRGDVEAFASGLAEYGWLKEAIDPAATGARIKSLVRPLERDLSAWELPGAGGGGFLLMVAQDEAAAARVRLKLAAHPPNGRAQLHEAAVDGEGLTAWVKEA
jgi:fucokinase